MQEAGDAEILRQVKDAEARMAQDPKHSGVFQDLARERDELQATVVDLQRTVEEMQVTRLLPLAVVLMPRCIC